MPSLHGEAERAACEAKLGSEARNESSAQMTHLCYLSGKKKQREGPLNSPKESSGRHSLLFMRKSYTELWPLSNACLQASCQLPEL